MTPRLQEKGSVAHIVIVVVLVVALLGALGFIFWQNVVKKDEPTPTPTQSSSNTTTDTRVTCESGEDTTASGGVFCSEAYGIKFRVPARFEGKLRAATNEPIYAVADTPNQIGTTDSVVSAQVSEGEYRYSLTVSLLPQIDTMSLGLIASGQFDLSDKKVYAVGFTAGDPVLRRSGEYTSVTSPNGITFYRDTYGDVGTLLFTDVAVIGEKVVVIRLQASPLADDALPGAAASLTDEQILATATLLD